MNAAVPLAPEACRASRSARRGVLRGALARALLATLLAAPAAAQPGGHASAAIPDVPAGPAAIRGRIVHGDAPAAAAGVEVVLYALPSSGVPGLRRTQSDANGDFAFEGVANDPETAYLVGARYGEIPFPGERVVFAAGELERRVEVRIAEASADPAAVSVRESRLRLDFVGSSLLATETHRLANESERVVYAPAAARASARPAFEAALPEGAGELTLPLGIVPEGLARQAGRVAFYGPVYPGEQEISFSYTLPLPEGATTLRKTLPSPARLLRVLVAEGAVQARSPQLREGEAERLDGKRYRALEATDLAAGAGFALTLERPPLRQDPAALAMTESRLFLELDAAALVVREEHRLQVAGDTGIVGSLDEPLLRIELPEGAEDVRFATTPPGITLAPGPEGGLALPGPLPAGASTVELVYRVPAGQGSTTLERRFARSVPLLTVYVADTGLHTESGRLHRRRPVRSEDRAYLHLEAFEVAAGESVSLRLAALPPRPDLPRSAQVLLVALVAAGVVAFLVAPLQRSAGRAAELAQEPAARREREALYAAIRDLDDDFETGKLTEDDHRTLREDLRRRAVALLQQERAAEPVEPTVAAEAPATPTCDACGFAARPGDRFCAGCGRPIAAPSLLRRELSA